MIYSVEVRIYATAYIRANSAAEALELAKGLKGHGLGLPEGDAGDLEISGRRFDDPALPDVSLSPAMTVHGVDADAEACCAEDG